MYDNMPNYMKNSDQLMKRMSDAEELKHMRRKIEAEKPMEEDIPS